MVTETQWFLFSCDYTQNITMNFILNFYIQFLPLNPTRIVVLILRAPTCKWINMSYLSGTENALDVCVPLLEPFSLSKVPFLSNDFSVWEEQERKGRMIKYVFSALFTTIESQINIFFLHIRDFESPSCSRPSHQHYLKNCPRYWHSGKTHSNKKEPSPE